MANDYNQKIIDEFRSNEGRVGGPFEGARLILLTTTGRRSGEQRTSPLGRVRTGDGRTFVIASAAGADTHPAWYHNLVADPRVTVEDGTRTYAATATVLTGDERDKVFAEAAAANPGWAEYQAGTARIIPVVALQETA
ncbi:nitroreductase family deazaflavin-dependent oxidoreductase [Actinoplanes sp. NPDC051494]|uniref:nitroreductase family deazaflavin-dependent oxidoreductase n=1 Tax=Actinoplanes sp. NPDC051494 TaxID=3363907 RepID=UPI0037AB96D4